MRHTSGQRSGEFGSYEASNYGEDNENYRGSRRKLDTLGNRSQTQERRKKDVFEFDRNIENIHKFSKSSKDVYYHHQDAEDRFEAFDDDDSQRPVTLAPPLQQQKQPQLPRSITNSSNNKFNFDDEQGFESDFNSPINGGGKSLRFSTDFSEKKHHLSHNTSDYATAGIGTSVVQPASAITTSTSQKLRFDDNITVAKFDTNTDDMFDDDDFSKAEFSFENEDQWNSQLPRKNNLKTTKRSENIRKSESVNIFAKKQEDPFEDDDFFKESNSDQPQQPEQKQINNRKNNDNGSNYNWEKNFAKFDENI